MDAHMHMESITTRYNVHVIDVIRKMIAKFVENSSSCRRSHHSIGLVVALKFRV